jgi:hypothetical protein
LPATQRDDGWENFVSFSWQGASGRWYEFDVARSKRQWQPVGGIYMFVKPGDYPTMEAGGPITLYVAQTASFADALTRHDMWAPAQSLGAAEIHLVEISDPAARTEIERDLLRSHTPILNRPAQRAAA